MSETAFGMVIAFSPVLVASTVLLVLAGIDAIGLDIPEGQSMPDITALFSAALASKDAHERSLEALANAQAAADTAATQRQQAAQALMVALGIASPIVVLELNLDQHLRAIKRQLGNLTDMVLNLQQSEKILMTTSQDALDLLKKIDDATTKQGTALAAEGNTLQTVSDELDALIAKLNAGGNVDPVVMAAIQAQADKVQAVSDSIDVQAAFSTALAQKAANPVPLPIPDPTPPGPAPTPPAQQVAPHKK